MAPTKKIEREPQEVIQEWEDAMAAVEMRPSVKKRLLAGMGLPATVAGHCETCGRGGLWLADTLPPFYCPKCVAEAADGVREGEAPSA